jgi:molybdopterin molybdotransferase
MRELMVDCFSAPGLVPLENAMEQLLGLVNKTENMETVDLEHALGRVLAKDQISHLSIPPADNSAMDGYALKSANGHEGATLKMVAKVFAGHPISDIIKDGECVRIMTGGQIPLGCDAVSMQENVSANGQEITINQTVQAGENVRRKGEDINVGQSVLTSGQRLTASHVGLLASLGNQHICVYKKLTVALISTGDELKKPGQTLNVGQFFESNTYTVRAILKRLDMTVLDFGIIPDDLELLRKTFADADAQADIVITSGGVSVGEADFTKTVLEELGEIQFWKLAIKPGKPFAFGLLPNSYFFGLPGNPVSAMVTMHQLAAPLLRKISGEGARASLRLQAKTLENIRKRPGRTDFQRGIYSIDEKGLLSVRPNGAQGSGILSSMSGANCYIVLEQQRGSVDVGEQVLVEPFDELLG